MTQLEFYKSYQFLVELLAAECLFILRLQRRKYFIPRALIALAACWAIFRFFPILSQNAFYISFMFFVLFAATVFACKFLYKERWLVIVFCCVAGYTTQHMSYEIYNLLLTVMGANTDSPMGFYGNEFSAMFSNPLLLMLYLVLYACIYFGVYWIFGRRINRHEGVYLKNGFVFISVVLILVVDVLLNAVVVFSIAEDENNLYMIVVGVYNILCCLFALYLQFEVLLRRQLQNTLATLRQLWNREREQYAVSKENIALINMKCHDMRHQIRSIGRASDMSSSAVAEIENLISIYDSTVKTGNEALDIILSEKSLLCSKNGITFSCIADGKQLDFMKEEDIYSLFGNIVDNAMEAVSVLPPEKRVISLHVKSADTLVSVNANNWYKNDLEFEGGLPLTTKKDKEFHGFGMQSIRYITEMYGGNMQINADGGIFNLNILFERSV